MDNPLQTIRSQTPVLSTSISLRFTRYRLVEGLYPLSYGCVWGYYTAGVAEVNFYYRAELDVNPVE
jgi:hypothetical protein